MRRHQSTWNEKRVQALAAAVTEAMPRDEMIEKFGFRNRKHLSDTCKSLRRRGHAIPPLHRCTAVKDLAWEKRVEIQALWERKEPLTLEEVVALGFKTRAQLLQGIESLRRRGFDICHKNISRVGLSRHQPNCRRYRPTEPKEELPVSRADVVARQAKLALQRKGRAVETVTYRDATIYRIDGDHYTLPQLIEQAGLLQQGRVTA